MNDLAFAGHAVVLCVITYSQFWPVLWGFRVAPWQRVSRAALGILWGSLGGVFFTAAIVRTGGPTHGIDPSGWAWIDVVSFEWDRLPALRFRKHANVTGQIYAISYVKLIVTVVKYIPQAWTNYKRKSTVGWSINQILLDFAGGIFSILQLLIDSSLQADWSGVTGNPVKFGLGNVSILFDIIFMLQHYVWYPTSSKEVGIDEERPLLQGEI